MIVVPCKICISTQNWLLHDYRSSRSPPGSEVRLIAPSHSIRGHITYKTANLNEIWVDLSAGAALDFESVPEVVLRRVIGPEISYPSDISLPQKSLKYYKPSQIRSKGESQHYECAGVVDA